MFREGGGGQGAHVNWAPWRECPETAGVFTDYDGALASIAADRNCARPLPGAREALVRLTRCLGTVAVVPGRPLEYLRGQRGVSKASCLSASTAWNAPRTATAASSPTP